MKEGAAPIGVVGTGYVGLVTAVCFAHLGHRVVCMDVDAAKIEGLRRGMVPIYEPGLDKLIDDNAARLSFTTSYDELLAACHTLFIAVDTPPTLAGDADLSRVLHATHEIAAARRAAPARHEEHRAGGHRRAHRRRPRGRRARR